MFKITRDGRKKKKKSLKSKNKNHGAKNERRVASSPPTFGDLEAGPSGFSTPKRGAVPLWNYTCGFLIIGIIRRREFGAEPKPKNLRSKYLSESTICSSRRNPAVVFLLELGAAQMKRPRNEARHHRHATVTFEYNRLVRLTVLQRHIDG
ncbi:hypothetical protein DAPPUDRAFT_236619 [Daphnia pulex]|uniref:Uncharacterized protein n=1 Tax=Daphnia pulex TaxID=6669 RepID=E9G2P5_DAPPU|nr:hypothetical protein DAPPUDRAFT_236619 [Daphnia pulex]|eukprot:EFX86475.1 hypothetical protein DAPPUDRAFT_236619 [Daphnia pulex]